MAHEIETGATQTNAAANELATIANRSSELVRKFKTSVDQDTTDFSWQ